MKIICNFSFLYILSNFYTGGIYIFPPQQTLRVTLLERQRSAHNWDKAETHWLHSVWSCYFTWIRKQMNLLWTSLSSWIMLYLTFKHTLNYLLHFLLISGHLKIGALKKYFGKESILHKHTFQHFYAIYSFQGHSPYRVQILHFFCCSLMKPQHFSCSKNAKCS